MSAKTTRICPHKNTPDRAYVTLISLTYTGNVPTGVECIPNRGGNVCPYGTECMFLWGMLMTSMPDKSNVQS